MRWIEKCRCVVQHSIELELLLPASCPPHAPAPSGHPENARAPGLRSLRPPFTGRMLVCSNHRRVHDQPLHVLQLQQDFHHLLPVALLSPASETTVNRVPLAEPFRQRSPGRSGPENPKHCVDEQAVVRVDARSARTSAGQQGLDVLLLGIAQFLTGSTTASSVTGQESPIPNLPKRPSHFFPGPAAVAGRSAGPVPRPSRPPCSGSAPRCGCR